MESLGINPLLLATQILNFLIMAGVLTFLIYKPLMKGLDEKKKKTEEELLVRQNLLAEEEKMEEKRKKTLTAAREEGAQLVKEAVNDAKKKTREMFDEERVQLKEEKEKLLSELAKERGELLKAGKEHAIAIATLITKQLIGETLTAHDQKKLLKNALSDLSKSKVN